MRVWVLDAAGEVRNPLWDATYIIVLDEVTHTRLALLSNYYRGNKPVDGTPVHVITLLAVEKECNTCCFTCLRDDRCYLSFAKENLNLLVMSQMHVQERGISLAAGISVPGSLHSPQGAHGCCGLYTEPQNFLHFSWTSYRNQLVKMFTGTRVTQDLTEESVSEK